MSKLSWSRLFLGCVVIAGCAGEPGGADDGDGVLDAPDLQTAAAGRAASDEEPVFVGDDARSSPGSRTPPEQALPDEGPQESSDKASGCRTYYGGCSGFWWGTSCAEGEGWRYCVTVGQTYAWMTICGDTGSHPSSYGQGWCWF